LVISIVLFDVLVFCLNSCQTQTQTRDFYEKCVTMFVNTFDLIQLNLHKIF